MECPRKTADGADLIIGYAAGTLSTADKAAFECHLESCGSCREITTAQRTVWSALDELTPLPVSPNFDAKLYQRIGQEQHAAWWQRMFRADWSWHPAMPVAAACAMLIVAFLVKNGGPSNEALPQGQSQLQIEQVERALDDMDMLKQAGVESTLEKPTLPEQL